MARYIEKSPPNVQQEPQLSLSKVRLPALPLTGGCQCGMVRYRVTAEPVAFYLCHCRECQRQTSSAFGESLRVRAKDLVMEGPVKTVARTAESGRRRKGHFCGECGVRLAHSTVGADQANVKAGTLDDTSWLMPAGHIWTRSKPFIAIGAGELSYPTQPEDGYAALAERWRAMLAKS